MCPRTFLLIFFIVSLQSRLFFYTWILWSQKFLLWLFTIPHHVFDINMTINQLFIHHTQTSHHNFADHNTILQESHSKAHWTTTTPRKAKTTFSSTCKTSVVKIFGENMRLKKHKSDRTSTLSWVSWCNHLHNTEIDLIICPTELSISTYMSWRFAQLVVVVGEDSNGKKFRVTSFGDARRWFTNGEAIDSSESAPMMDPLVSFDLESVSWPDFEGWMSKNWNVVRGLRTFCPVSFCTNSRNSSGWTL